MHHITVFFYIVFLNFWAPPTPLEAMNISMATESQNLSRVPLLKIPSLSSCVGASPFTETGSDAVPRLLVLAESRLNNPSDALSLRFQFA